MGVPEVGYPHQPGPTGGRGLTRGGVPPWPGLMGEGVPKVGYPLGQGTPWPGLTGGLPEVGYPPVRVPPWPGLMGWYPTAGTPLWGTPQLAGPGWGTPPPPQVWTDKQSETITFPLVLRTRSVKKYIVIVIHTCHGILASLPTFRKPPYP